MLVAYVLTLALTIEWPNLLKLNSTVAFVTPPSLMSRLTVHNAGDQVAFDAAYIK